MAEYKKFSCPQGNDFEGGDECDRCDQYEICMETPDADVIERSKINKAIEKITKLRDSIDRMITGETSLVNECYKQYVNCYDECLKIIKENIGDCTELGEDN